MKATYFGILIIALCAGPLLDAVLGCKSAFVPTVIDLSAIVLHDIEAGDPPAQIASDVCKSLGGTSLTDTVCADVTTVVADIVQNLISSGKLSAAGETHARIILDAMHPSSHSSSSSSLHSSSHSSSSSSSPGACP